MSDFSDRFTNIEDKRYRELRQRIGDSKLHYKTFWAFFGIYKDL